MKGKRKIEQREKERERANYACFWCRFNSNKTASTTNSLRTKTENTALLIAGFLMQIFGGNNGNLTTMQFRII